MGSCFLTGGQTPLARWHLPMRFGPDESHIIRRTRCLTLDPIPRPSWPHSVATHHGIELRRTACCCCCLLFETTRAVSTCRGPGPLRLVCDTWSSHFWLQLTQAQASHPSMGQQQRPFCYRCCVWTACKPASRWMSGPGAVGSPPPSVDVPSARERASEDHGPRRAAHLA